MNRYGNSRQTKMDMASTATDLKHVKWTSLCRRIAPLLSAIILLSTSTPGFSASSTKTPAKSGDSKSDTKKDDKAQTEKLAPEPVLENVQKVSALELVDKPHEYMSKNVKFSADFYAYTSLALDYKPALRPSKTHLSFLVLRPNTKIPLSELKLAMAMPKEKDPENQVLTSLKEGDELEILGKVFSTALDEPWVDVVWFRKVKSAKDDKKEGDLAKNDSHPADDKNSSHIETHKPDVDKTDH